MKRVAAHPVSHDLGENGRVPLFREFKLFENQNARAFAHDESIAIPVERPRCMRRIVVVLRQRPHGGEPANAERRDAGFRPAADHRNRIAALDDFEGVADRMRARGARGRGRRVRPFRAGAD